MPATFCNPLDLDYGWGGKGHRHSADPVIVLFKNRYYLFATDDLPGCRMSDDLLGEEDAGAWLGRFAMLPCQEAAWRVDAYNANGVTEGRAATGGPRTVRP